MSLNRSGYAVSRCWGLLGVFLSAVLALPLFDPAVATAQDTRQIQLTEKHMQGFIAVFEDIAQLYDGANPYKPDPKLEAQAEALVKKNGFASLTEYDDISMNIAMILSGIDQQTKTFIEPPDQIKKEIASIKANESVPEAQKRRTWCSLRPRSRTQSPFNSRKTSRWC